MMGCSAVPKNKVRQYVLTLKDINELLGKKHYLQKNIYSTIPLFLFVITKAKHKSILWKSTYETVKSSFL